MNKRNILSLFTSSLAELTSSGVPLKYSLEIISSLENIPAQICSISKNILASLEEGISFSSAVASCEKLSAPEWYVSFIATAEKSGIVGGTLSWISSVIEEQKLIHEKIVLSLVYPALVIILTFVCGTVCSVCLLKGKISFSSYLCGSLFLVVSLTVLFAIVKRIIAGSSVTRIVKSLSFLTKANVPLESALVCVLPSSNENEKLSRCLIHIRSLLAAGESADLAFLNQLSVFGYKREGKIISLYLSLSKSGNTSLSFEHSYQILEKREEKIRNDAVACIQPIVLCIAAVYMTIILQQVIVPVLYGGAGGLL